MIARCSSARCRQLSRLRALLTFGVQNRERYSDRILDSTDLKRHESWLSVRVRSLSLSVYLGPSARIVIVVISAQNAVLLAFSLAQMSVAQRPPANRLSQSARRSARSPYCQKESSHEVKSWCFSPN